MLKIENCEVVGWEHAIRGMRNPMNSWDQSDTNWWRLRGDDAMAFYNDEILQDHIFIQDRLDNDRTAHVYLIGPKDKALMMKLRRAGSDHRKFMRMINIYLDITAPLYWWKEFDTYKVGTVANSCSTMHKIHSKEFTIDDFSTDQMTVHSKCLMDDLIKELNEARAKFLDTNDKKYWWQMIQLLSTSYNQKRTVMLSYEAAANMYRARKITPHKLDEWHTLCDMFEDLPFGVLITGKDE